MSKGLVDLIEELVRFQCLGQVYDGLLLVVDQIGVVRDAFLSDGPQPFKEVGRAIVDADLVDVGFDLDWRHLSSYNIFARRRK